MARVLLVGMMGAGKTTVGNALSALIGWPYFDNDELLLRAVGKATRRVQEEDGVHWHVREPGGTTTVPRDDGAPRRESPSPEPPTVPLRRARRRLH